MRDPGNEVDSFQAYFGGEGEGRARHGSLIEKMVNT